MLTLDLDQFPPAKRFVLRNAMWATRSANAFAARLPKENINAARELVREALERMYEGMRSDDESNGEPDPAEVRRRTLEFLMDEDIDDIRDALCGAEENDEE